MLSDSNALLIFHPEKRFYRFIRDGLKIAFWPIALHRNELFSNKLWGKMWRFRFSQKAELNIFSWKWILITFLIFLLLKSLVSFILVFSMHKMYKFWLEIVLARSFVMLYQYWKCNYWFSAVLNLIFPEILTELFLAIFNLQFYTDRHFQISHRRFCVFLPRDPLFFSLNNVLVR